jgi:hypothetical protein
VYQTAWVKSTSQSVFLTVREGVAVNEGLKNAAHLIRLALVCLICVLLFVAVRAAVVPPTFGQYGHYRGAALNENRMVAASYAGQDTCAVCHAEVLATKDKGVHKTIHCEACHGPQVKHTEDPTTVKPVKPNAQTLCPRCHEKDAARPAWFKQVDIKAHSQGLECAGCHTPHSPKLQ